MIKVFYCFNFVFNNQIRLILIQNNALTLHITTISWIIIYENTRDILFTPNNLIYSFSAKYMLSLYFHPNTIVGPVACSIYMSLKARPSLTSLARQSVISYYVLLLWVGRSCLSICSKCYLCIYIYGLLAFNLFTKTAVIRLWQSITI